MSLEDKIKEKLAKDLVEIIGVTGVVFFIPLCILIAYVISKIL